MSPKILLAYFLLGGTVVTLVTYLGGQGKGLLAAFIAAFPAMTLLTFILIHSQSGVSATISYAKGLLIITPAWLLYVACVLILLPRWGMARALGSGILIYILASGLFSWVLKRWH